MNRIDEYQYVYEKWYCESCEKSNEAPVSFSVYLKIMPNQLIQEIKKMLDEGERP